MNQKVIEPGAVIGNGYKLERKIGQSQAGDIYLASKGDGGQMFRVQVLSGSVGADDETVSRFLQEIDLMSTLKHENLLSAVEAGQDGSSYFLVMEHQPGMSLEEKIKEHGSVPEKDALAYMIGVAAALQYLWDQRKLLHRDLKPQNVFVTDSGKVKLTGFGIAKSSEGQSMGLTGVGFTIGTPEYMSPEQIRASEDLDFRSDMYALGVVLYEALVGQLPFVEEAPILLMQKHMDEIPVPVRDRNSAVSEGCSQLVDKMLAKERDERFESWQAFIDHAKKVIETGGVVAGSKKAASKSSSAADVGQKPLATSGNSPAVIIGVVVAVVVVIVVILLMMKGGK